MENDSGSGFLCSWYGGGEVMWVGTDGGGVVSVEGRYPLVCVCVYMGRYFEDQPVLGSG